jgi:hypothetical protein
MTAKLTITKAGESWGEIGHRTHQQESEFVAERRLDWVAFSIKQGARNSYDDAPKGAESQPEAVAAIVLSPHQVRTLAAFLASLPDDAQ